MMRERFKPRIEPTSNNHPDQEAFWSLYCQRVQPTM